ncbi:MAG: hypothetical protein ACI9SQ_001495 [Rubritalea sp.]
MTSAGNDHLDKKVMDLLSIYKLIHYVGIFTLMLSLGSIFTKYNKCAVIGHGVGLLLIIIGGLGLQTKMGIDLLSGWLVAKIVIWLIFGASIALAKRGILKGSTAWIAAIGLGSVAAYLGLMKPF